MQLKTKQGYDFYEVASAMQKAIRRGDVKLAGYFALELWVSGYTAYTWKRLLTVSAEDCAGIITQEIWALCEGYNLLNTGLKRGEQKGRIFISKAVIILCEAIKSRDSDHLQNFVYDKKKWISDEMIEQYFDEVRTQEKIDIPEYAFDVHTKKGKLMGMTKADFFKDELEALTPKSSTDQFDKIIDD